MKLGIFGGTFDPVHNAHLFVAESARKLENLDRIIFVPTNTTHYREGALAGANDRCAMIASAIASNPELALDRSDLEPDATGYTADLIPRIAERYPGASLSFISGADSLAAGSWVRMEEILERLESFIIAPRAGVSEKALSQAVSAVPIALRKRIKTLNLPEIPESATLIRRLLAEGKSIRYLVPEPVWRYIVENNMYASGAVVA